MKSQYPRAAQAIRRWISVENLPPGASLPSTRALAAELGFNHAAIARACNILISGSVLQRTGYKMTVNGRGADDAPVLGVVDVVTYSEGFGRDAARILTEQRVRYRLVELSFTQHPNMEEALRIILATKPAGLILWIPRLDEGTKRLLEATDIPLVLCTADARRLNRSSVGTDLYRGTEQALRHLYDLGHRHIAHVSQRGWIGATFNDEVDDMLAQYYRTVCLKLDLKSSSSLIWRAETSDEMVLVDAMRVGLRRHPEVTAIFCDDLAGFYATKTFAVPRKLSVVGFWGTAEGLASRPPLTTVAVQDATCMVSWACMEIISQLRTIQSGLPPKATTQALFVPRLIVRGSTRALSRGKVRASVPGKSSSQKSTPEETWRNVYPMLRNSGSHHWLHLDLSKLVNHSLTRQHGWLGAEPLEHFPPGLRSIHGVPFQVLDEKHHGGHAVVTFRSPHSHSSRGARLPARAKMKVGTRAKALYFLHGCGYGQPMAFASYNMHYREGASVSVPLIPLGPSRQVARRRLGHLQPNLQDWWPEFEQADFPHAHRVTVFDPANPTAYERTIYSLEWINPRPDEELSHVEVRVDPAAGPALALIAMTALL